MPGKKPRMYFGTPEDEQSKHSSLHTHQPISKRNPRLYYGQPEPALASTEDTQADIPEQDDSAAFLRQLDAPPARVRQLEAQWQQDPQEPDRYQPSAGYSRFGRDIQTGEYIDVPQASRRQGLYIIGIQGTGKTGLIENLIVQDIKQGKGVGLLDPHGDLTRAVLSRVPVSREGDVIYLDLTDFHYPFGLNLFACSDLTSPLEVQKTVDRVMHVFEKVVSVSQDTPLILDYLRYCTYVLIANPGYTMADIRLLLKQKSCRHALLRNVPVAEVRDFWDDYDQLPAKDQNERSEYVLRRVRNFLQPLTHNIVGQSTSTIDIRQVMDERKILLVKLSTELPSITSLIGSVFIALFLQAANSRADLPVNKRKQFNLYADEFQRFATEDFATLLEEARKYGIATTIAHQNRSQLESKNEQLETNLKDRTRSVANLVVFKVNSKDADDLAGEFDITPQEAWEEELEEERLDVRKPQRHRRVEEQVEEEVEEEVKAIPTNPVDFLVSARGTHGSAKVRRATQEILVPLVLAAEGKGDVVKEHREIIAVYSPYVSREVVKKLYHGISIYSPQCGLPSLQEGKNLLNVLLVDVMEGRLQLRSRELAGRIEAIAIQLAGFIGWYGFPRNRENSLFLGHEWRLEYGLQYESSLFRASSALIRWCVALGQQPGNSAMKASEQEFHSQLLEMLRKYGYQGDKGEYGGEMKALALRAGASLETFVQNLHILCKELATEEGKIKVPTGQMRMVKRIRKYPTWLTDESEKITHPRVAITHPQRSYEDMKKQVASEVTNLNDYLARVLMKNADGKRVEHTVRTLKPEVGLQDNALQARLNSIKEQNIQDGYVRLRQEVEEEMRVRQAQCSQPPQEPPVSRRPQQEPPHKHEVVPPPEDESPVTRRKRN